MAAAESSEQQQSLHTLPVTGGGLRAFCFQNVGKLWDKMSMVRFRNGHKHIFKTKNTHLKYDFKCVTSSALFLEYRIHELRIDGRLH